MTARLVTYLLTALAAVIASTVNQSLRHRLSFMRDLLFLINGSSEDARISIYESLRKHNVNHVLVTGDVSTSARRSEFLQFADEITKFDLGAGNVTIVPGNHDRIGLPGHDSFDDHFLWEKRPVVKEIAPGVIIVGVDSNILQNADERWDQIWDDLLTNLTGCFAESDMAFLREQLDGVSDETVIWGVHHPIIDDRPQVGRIKRLLRSSFRSPSKAEEIAGLIRSKPHLVLCGHAHPLAHRMVEYDGIRQAMGMASALKASVDGRRRFTYRIFEVGAKGQISPETVSVDVS